MTATKREAEILESNKKPPAKSRKGDNGSVVLTIMPVLNATLGQRELLAALTHIVVKFGMPDNDNILSRVDALVETGAGCIIGNFDYWADEVLTNPSMLLGAYTCKDEKYAPLTMHGVPDPNAKGDTHTIQPVINYGEHCLRAPPHPDLKRLPLVYKQPERGLAPVGHGSAAVHQAAFANLSKILLFVKILNAFSKDCPHLGYANQMANTLQSCTLDTIPARICDNNVVQKTGDCGAKRPSLQRASGPCDPVIGAHQNFDGTYNGNKENSADNNIPADSAHITFASTLEQERCAHAHG